MEDFVRLNLNAVMGITGFFLVLIVAYVIAMKKVKKEYKKYVHIGFVTILCITAFICVSTLGTQTSINNLPRSTVDKSYTDDATQSYQDRVKQSTSKEGK